MSGDDIPRREVPASMTVGPTRADFEAWEAGFFASDASIKQARLILGIDDSTVTALGQALQNQRECWEWAQLTAEEIAIEAEPLQSLLAKLEGKA